MKEPLLRGEIWLANFDPVVGHEQGGERPALVLSVDAFNSAYTDDVFVVPITSKFRSIRSRVAVRPPEGGLKMQSHIICEKMRSISRHRIKRKLGRISDETMEKVEEILRRILGL